jgi:hypothetical protein
MVEFDDEDTCSFGDLADLYYGTDDEQVDENIETTETED